MELSDTEMIIGKNTYPTRRVSLPQANLKFFIENPRVYSMFDRSIADPSQNDMESKLCECDDVRELRDSIEENGGLTVPIIVCNNVVIEGNRRLAAYRMLSKKDPKKWAYIPAEILPDDVPESAILFYLGQIHIVGQKDWAPFEQAGFLYRSLKTTGMSINELAESTGLKRSNVQKMVLIYEFMIDNDDQESKHWSYYEQYLTNRAIKKARETNEKLDKKIVVDIKAGKITDAKKEIREQLGVICKSSSSTQLVSDYVENRQTLKSCFESVDANDACARRILDQFRSKCMDSDFRSAIIYSTGLDRDIFKNDLSVIRNSIDFILKQMQKQ